MYINTKHLSAGEWLKTMVNVNAHAGTQAQTSKKFSLLWQCELTFP